MKTLVIYDSVYGNTEQIAKAIGGAIKGDVKVVKVGEADPSGLKTLDLLVIGSPTLGGRASQPMRDFIDKIPADVLKGLKVAAFDTRFSTKVVGVFGYAAGRIATSLKSKGANLVVKPEGFFVAGGKGPLKAGEAERAAVWSKGLAAGQK